MGDEDIDWVGVSLVMRSKNRKRILEFLSTSVPKTPTTISKNLSLHFNSVSRTLKELEEKEYVECLNPKEKLMRLYRTTNRGAKILKSIKESNISTSI